LGSVSVAGWIAHGVFAVLLLRVWVELRRRAAIVFALLWCAGYFGLPYILYGEPFFMPYVGVLDIIMLFRLMLQTKGDGLRLH
jgi:hypothetical protein